MVCKYFSPSREEARIQALVHKHGIFAGSFFNDGSVRARIATQYGGLPISIDEIRKLLFEATDFYVYVANTDSEIVNIIATHIYEQSLLSVLKNSKNVQDLNAWINERSVAKECQLCARMFRTVDLPSWIYYGSDASDFCCFACEIMKTPKKSELMDIIPRFVAECGFIPNADATPRTHSFTSRLECQNRLGIFGIYAQMGGIEHVKKKFGSWFQGLAESGALPDGVVATSRGIRCLAKDGHACHSLDEQQIDDWLYKHRIKHEREPKYPADPAVNPKGLRRADWKVGDI